LDDSWEARKKGARLAAMSAIVRLIFRIFVIIAGIVVLLALLDKL
jgi:hypothetical protein